MVLVVKCLLLNNFGRRYFLFQALQEYLFWLTTLQGSNVLSYLFYCQNTFSFPKQQPESAIADR